ncbi:MAG: PAS domain S-box protein [Cytophagales bacterium]|nr:MAG: PAS domain S-box protein [Cytophagales bacterium]
MTNPFFVVGVGASAGGLEALTELFANLPKTLEPQVCFIVAQHLSPNYRSMLVQILSKESVFPVVEAENNQPIQAGYVYITPPDSDIQINTGTIVLSKPKTQQGPKPSADILLASLAKNYGKNAIGIILSGTGSDGAIGMTEVKKQGGHALIQNPDTAKYDGMPIASLQTGLIDYSLPPAKIGQKITEIILQDAQQEEQPINIEEDALLQQIFALLNQRFGIDFGHYKTNTIIRRLDKAIKRLKIKSLEEYLHYIEKTPQELQHLCQSFLINVTSFFRDAEPYKALEKAIEKKISKGLLEDTFRVWIAGCSTGEEAYSIAMLIQNLLEQYNRLDCNIQIFATDIDEEALNIARKATYSIEQIKAIPEPFVEKFFIQTERGYEITKSLRSKVLFSKHDITLNPPFLKIDLISCRNLLIYLNNDIQRQIFPVFHYALKEDALLFLGKSESVTQVEELFETLEDKGKIFKKRKFLSSNTAIRFDAFKPLTIQSKKTSQIVPHIQSYQNQLNETFVNLTQHPYLVINSLLDIIETKGDWSDFTQIPEGALSLNINKLLRKEILLEAKNIILQTIKEQKNLSSTLKKVIINQKKFYIKIQCGIINNEKSLDSQPLYLLIIEKYDLEEDIAKLIPTTLNTTEHPRLQELEDELNLTKEHLQTYIEEIETANEELQSLNEELQSSNEELQSSNEELETSNEELQSTNEELQTAYAEIKHMNGEMEIKEATLEQSILLFNTLFDNTQQGNLLLDSNFNIRLINKEAITLFTKIGIEQIELSKNFTLFLSTTVGVEVYQLIQNASKNHQSSEKIITFHYLTEIYYYHFSINTIYNTQSNTLTYIIINIVDVTQDHTKEIALFRRDEMLTSLLESNTSYLIRTDMEGKYTYANNSFYQKFGFTPEQIIGKYYAHTVHPEDLKECEKAVEKLFQDPTQIVTFEMRKPNPEGGYFITEWEFATIRDQQTNIIEVQGVGRDITGFKQMQKQLEEEKNQLELMIWGGRLGTWDWNLISNEITFNERWAEMLGYSTEETNFSIDEWKALIHPDDRPKVIEVLEENIKGNTAYYDIAHRKKNKKGEWIWLQLTGKVVERDKKGKALRVLGIHQDITDKKRAEEAAKVSEARNESVVNTMQEGIVIQDMTGAIISCNHSAELILGLTYEQMIGRNSIDPRWRAIKENGDPFPGEEHPAMRTIKTGKPQTDVLMGVHKPEGDLSWISVNSQLLYHPDTKVPYAAFTMFHDITKQKIAENELAKEKQRLAYIIKGTNVGTWEWNIQTGETIFNERWAEIIGYSLEELQPIDINTWANNCHPDDLNASGELLQKHFAGEIDYYEFEARMKHKDGHWVWVLDRGKVYAWTEDGKPLLMSGTHQEITARKEAEETIKVKNQELAAADEELRANIEELKRLNLEHSLSEERLNKAQSIAKIGSWEFDLQTFSLIWSKEHYRIFELEENIPKEELYEAYRSKIYPEDLAKLDLIVKNAQEKGEGFVYEHSVICKDGTLKPVIGIGEVVFDGQKRPILLRGTVQDITEQRKSQEALIKNEELLRASIEASLEAIFLLEIKTNDKGEITDFIIKEINENASKQVQKTREQLIGFGICELFPINLTNGYFEQYKQVYQLRKPLTQEYYIPEGNPGAGWYYHQIVPMPNGIAIYNRDISERKKAEEDIKNLSEEYKQVFEGSQDAMFLVDYNSATHTFSYLRNNIMHQKLTGFSLDIIRGKTPQELVGDVLGEHVCRNYERCIAEQKSITYEEKLDLPAGEKYWLTTLTPVFQEGKNTYIVGSSIDITDRKKAENDILKEQKRFQDIVDSTDGIVWELDFSSFQFTYVSQKAVRLLGYEIEEWYQPDFWISHLHPEDQSWAIDYCLKCSAELEAHEFEYRFFAKDGREIWLRDFVTVVAENGQPVLLRGIMVDITKQKETENTILETNERLLQLEKFINQSTDAIQVADESGQLIYINKVASERLGISQENAHNYKVSDFEKIFAQKGTWEAHVKQLKAEEAVMVEGVNINQDTKKLFPVEVFVRYTTINDKGYIIAASRDISERKRMEQELHRLSMVARRTSNSVIISDTKKRIIWVNDAFINLTGYTLKEVFGKTPRLLQYEETDAAIIAEVNEKLNNKQAVRFEVKNKGKNGNVYWIDAEIQPMLDKNDHVTGFMAVQSDITARKEAESRIRKQNEVLKEIARQQSHEVRRPLANIIGLVNFIAEDAKTNQPANEQYVEYLLQSAKELDEIIHFIVEQTYNTLKQN